MRIAVPTSGGRLSPHFGRCDEFVLMNVDPQSRRIISVEKAVPPPHGPGVIPQWLSGFNVDVIIAGGMGVRAIELFQAAAIKVVRGAVVETPEDLVRDYLADQLVLGPDACDHQEGDDCRHRTNDHDLEG